VVKQKLVRAEQNGAPTESISSVPCMEKRRACFHRRSVRQHFAQSHFPQLRVRTCIDFLFTASLQSGSVHGPKATMDSELHRKQSAGRCASPCHRLRQSQPVLVCPLLPNTSSSISLLLPDDRHIRPIFSIQVQFCID
jgi:hypothetical protein